VQARSRKAEGTATTSATHQPRAASAANRTIQAKGGKQLRALAVPRTFKGPEVEVQKSLVAKLETMVQKGRFGREAQAMAPMCLGGVLLPDNLDMSPANLMKACSFVKVPNPAVRDVFDVMKDEIELQALIIKNTISTMIAAGQMEYLKRAGLADDSWVILVEVHYYRYRTVTAPILHKDTLGQTLFVNLNYVTDKEIAGPEYIVNPPAYDPHDQQTAATLPDRFRTHIRKARGKLAAPTRIESSVIPAHGVVSFVDELIHHATPLLRSRTKPITASELAERLNREFPVKYPQAVAAYDAYQKTGYWYAATASATSWLASWAWAPEVERRKWYTWIQMTRSNGRFDKLALQLAGFTPAELDKMLEVDDTYAAGFQQVSIPAVTGADAIAKAQLPRLERRMSSDLLRAKRFQDEQKVPKGQEPPPRRFFRTWVRAVPRSI